MIHGRTITGLLILFCLAAACQVTVPEAIQEAEMVLEAGFGANTKTSLDGVTCTWSDDDAIVVNGQASTGIEILASGKRARFTLPVVNPPYYAIYPAAAYNAGSYAPASGSYGTVTVPAVQSYVPGSFDAEAAIMVATEEAVAGIDFVHAMSYIRLTVNAGADNHAISEISVRANSDEDLCGLFTFDPTTSSLVGDGKTGKRIAIDCGEGIALGSTIVIALPARDYETGLSIRIRDVKNHFQDITSSKRFTAEAGRIYNTEVTFKPTGTLIEGQAPDPTQGEEVVRLTPFSELNAGPQTVNSHAGECGETSLMKDYRSYTELGPAFGLNAPQYPRIRSLADGSFLLTWQQSDVVDDGNGMDVWYALSEDGVIWENKGKLFPRVEGYATPDGITTKVYTNGNAIVLPNGTVCAVASFRPYASYDKAGSQLYSGIEIKHSANNGKTWTTVTKVIHRGPNWEAHFVQKRSGRLECYFSESHPLISGSNSGTAMVYSDDNGSTWYPALGTSPWSTYAPLHCIRHNWPADTPYPERYTDQMPVLVQLNNSDQIVGVFESLSSFDTSTQVPSFRISQSRSSLDGNWPDLADGPSGWRGNGGEISSTQADYYNPSLVSAGAAPYIIQFPSGETVMSYWNGRQYAIIGDENARNYSSAFTLFDEAESCWGGLDVCGSHEMMATVRLGRGGDASTSNPPALGIVRYALNHSISATARTVQADGTNLEWAKSDEALFVGAKSQAQATLRCSADAQNIYFLVEVMDESLSASDYAELYLSAPANSLGTTARRIRVNKDGLVSVSRRGSILWTTDNTLGISAASAVVDPQGWLAEICVPRSAVTLGTGGVIATNLTLYESSSRTTDKLRDDSPSTWVKIKNL